MGGVQTDLDGRTTIGGLVRGGRGGVHRRSRRQPSRQQLAARGAGVRRPCRTGDARRPEGTASPSRPSRIQFAGSRWGSRARVCRRCRAPAPAGDVARRRAVPRTGPASRPSSASSNRCGGRSTPGWRTTAARCRGLARREHPDRRPPHRPCRAAPRREPRRALPRRFPGPRRYTLDSDRICRRLDSDRRHDATN